MALPLLPILSLGASAVGALGSLRAASEAARERRRATDEQVRRFELGADRALGEARARGAASGVEADSSSLQLFVSEMDAEFRRQADWIRRSGYTEARLGKEAGILGAASGLGGALFTFGAQNNWWRSPTLPTAAPSYTPGSGGPLWR